MSERIPLSGVPEICIKIWRDPVTPHGSRIVLFRPPPPFLGSLKSYDRRGCDTIPSVPCGSVPRVGRSSRSGLSSTSRRKWSKRRKSLLVAVILLRTIQHLFYLHVQLVHPHRGLVTYDYMYMCNVIYKDSNNVYHQSSMYI
jgi:hypothetical protein